VRLGGSLVFVEGSGLFHYEMFTLGFVFSGTEPCILEVLRFDHVDLLRDTEEPPVLGYFVLNSILECVGESASWASDRDLDVVAWVDS